MELSRVDKNSYTDMKHYNILTGYLAEDTEGDLIVYESLDENEAVAAAVLEPMGDGARLDMIYVDEDRRRQGLATEFLADMVFDLRDRGFRVFYMDYLASKYPAVDALAKRFEMDRDKGSVYLNMKLSDFKDVAMPAHAGKGIVSLSKLGKEELALLTELVSEADNHPGYDPLSAPGLDRELSMIHRDEEPDGALLVERDGEGIYISFMWSDSKDVMLLERLISATVKTAEGICKPDTVIEASVSDDKLAAYLKREFDITGENVMEATFELSKLAVFDEETE